MSYQFKTALAEIEYHTDYYFSKNNIEIESITLSKVFLCSRIEEVMQIVNSKRYFLFYFMINDETGFNESGIKESNISIDLVKTTVNSEFYIFGTAYIYLQSGIKEEKLICFDSISRWTYWLLKSSLNPVLTPTS